MIRRAGLAARGAGLRRWFCALAVLITVPLSSRAQMLAELHQAAFQVDPVVAGAQAQVRAAQERVTQARAAFGPTAVATASKSATRYNEAPRYDLRKFSSKQAALQITQPLLRTALFPTLESAKAQLDQAQSALDQVKSEVSVRLIEVCFDVLKARDALTFIGAQLVAAEEQLASARRSFKVGTTAITDVRDAEAKIDTVLAQRIAAEAELDLKQQLLLELVGRPAPEVLGRAISDDQMPVLPQTSVLEWIADAQTQSPQLQQAQFALVAAEAEVTKAWQGHAPTADLTYSYTMSSDTGTVTSFFPRRGDASQVGFNVNIPLFASGATDARVKETVALRDKARSDVDAARRNVQISVRQSFSASLSSIALARGLETANRSLEVALRANRRGYEVGLKINAEVLESQSKLFEARRDLSRSRYDAWLNFLKLKAAAGRMSTADIDTLDRLLVAVEPLVVRGRQPRQVAP
jgi:outer membrane protein